MNVFEEMYNNTVQKLEIMTEQNQRLKERLSRCEEALRYYANIRNYKTMDHAGIVAAEILQNDHESADNTRSTTLAGRRARSYFKEYSLDANISGENGDTA